MAESSCIRGKATAIVAVALAVVLAFTLGLGAAGGAGQAHAASSTGFTIGATSVSKGYSSNGKKMTMSMVYGDKTTITVKKSGAKKAKWTSSNKKVVAVKSTGKYKAKVTAKSAGTATVTAKIGKKKLKCKVTVIGELTTTSITTTPLATSSVFLKGAAAASWASSNTGCVEVSPAGVVTPKATGTATLTCTDTKGNSYKCAVAVKCPSITCTFDDNEGTDPVSIGDKDYYFKNFTFTNQCGQTVVLSESVMHYYPDGRVDNCYKLYACNRGETSADGETVALHHLSDQAITVNTAQSTSFMAHGNEGPLWTGSFSRVFMYFKVNDTQYLGAFNALGNMTYCTKK